MTRTRQGIVGNVGQRSSWLERSSTGISSQPGNRRVRERREREREKIERHRVRERGSLTES